MSITIRPALESDFPAIRRLIHQVGINPTGLDWRRFLVVVDERGKLLGCGQVKPHRDGTRELASIAVVPEHRGEGIARQIIQRLLDQHPGTLYLTCRASLGALYAKFGFREASAAELTPYFKRLHRLSRLILRLGIAKEPLLIMLRAG